MDSVLPFVVLVLWTVTDYTTDALSPTTIHASVPVNPVQTDGILSLHCQARNLKDGHEVALYRTIGQHVQRLSMGDTVADADDDRTFLATRQMDDSSIVYFLSIIGAKRQDAGDYSCRVISAVGVISEVAADSVAIDVAYFPSDNFPICTSSEPIEVTDGSLATFKCASEISKPAVTIQWKRNGAILDTATIIDIRAKEQYSKLSFRVSSADNGAVFLCEMTSPLFPGLSRTCHVGPIRVKPSSGSIGNDRTNTDSSGSNVVSNDPTTTPVGNLTSQCHEFCSVLSSKEFYWIIATVASVLIAVIFLLLTVSLSIRYFNMADSAGNNDAENYNRRLHRVPTEYIYTEVEARKEMEKNYMSLERQNSRKYPLE